MALAKTYNIPSISSCCRNDFGREEGVVFYPGIGGSYFGEIQESFRNGTKKQLYPNQNQNIGEKGAKREKEAGLTALSQPTAKSGESMRSTE